MTKGVTDYSELLDEAGERRNAAFIIGARWRLWYQKSGDASIKDIIKQSKIPYEGQTIDPTEVDGYIDLFTRQIVRTQSTQITDLVDQALQDGKPIKQIAKELESSGKVFGAKRAKLIAQTQATRAANLGTQDAFTQATAMGIRMRKEWLSARDEKVRTAHSELDGQVVGVNENFTSEDKDGKPVEAMSPASFGIAEQDINCRCTMLPVVED
jgi:SPP1 gp7 family putative phage head morphogenesis protein